MYASGTKKAAVAGCFLTTRSKLLLLMQNITTITIAGAFVLSQHVAMADTILTRTDTAAAAGHALVAIRIMS